MEKYNNYHSSAANKPWKNRSSFLHSSVALKLLVLVLLHSSPRIMSLLIVNPPFLTTVTTATRVQSYYAKITTNTRASLLIKMAAKGGFGTSSSSNSGPGNVIKLKPKSQWDRYLSITAPPARVAVRTGGEQQQEEDEWLEVGWVKHVEEENLSVDMVVARQRALIAEHAKRLFPLKILPKSQLVWGYYKEGGGNGWIEVNVKEVDMTIPEGLEKKIGFEGVADPSSGYYCVYKEGRMVTGSEKQSGVQQGRGVGPASGKSFTSKKKIGE